MSFLDVKAVPTMEDGVFYNPSFNFDQVFPEIAKQRDAVARAMDEIDPGRTRPRAEVLKEVDPKLRQDVISQTERAKRLHRHAFCQEDGSPLPEQKLSDYHISMLNDLYDLTMAEIVMRGKSRLETLMGGLDSTLSSAD